MHYQHIVPILEDLALFYQIKSEDIPTLLTCLGASVRSYQKGAYLLTEGQEVSSLLIILNGSVHLYKNAGTAPSLMGQANQGQVLGAASIGREIVSCPLSAMAATDCTVLSIPYRRLMFQCTRSCPFHHRLVENLVIVISEGQRQLYQKIYVLSQKTIRDKLLTLLQEAAADAGSKTFTLPYNRTELAHYLCADRSALTRELTNMKKEGILTFHQNSFTLLD